MTAIVSSSLILVFCLAAGAGTEDIRKAKSVQFHGLRYLTKYDIVRGVGLKAVDKGIIIDVDSLRRSLSKNDFIKSYRIEEIEGGLAVSIIEKRPAHVVVVSMGGRSTTYELDAAYSVISKNTAHANILPVVHITDAEEVRGGLQASVKRLFAVLERVERRNAGIYRELSEVYLSGNSIRVILRGRKTDFVMAPRESEFVKLRYIAGYLDKTKKYPDKIIISDNAAIVRRIAGDAINR